VKLSKNKLIEKTLNKYKKLYEDGKITKKIFLKKKRRLLERL
jgi:Mn-dependent DtxR family transcriptional regulator